MYTYLLCTYKFSLKVLRFYTSRCSYFVHICSMLKKKKGKPWYLIFDGLVCEIKLNSSPLVMLAVQSLPGEIPNLPTASNVVIGLFPPIPCRLPAIPQPCAPSRCGNLAWAHCFVCWFFFCWFSACHPDCHLCLYWCPHASRPLGKALCGGRRIAWSASPGWKRQCSPPSRPDPGGGGEGARDGGGGAGLGGTSSGPGIDPSRGSR